MILIFKIIDQMNRNTLFTNDLLYRYMIYSDLKNIKTISQIDRSAYKLCHSNYFWTNKLLHDRLSVIKPMNTMIEYEKILNATTKSKFLSTYKHIEFMNVIGNLSSIFNTDQYDNHYSSQNISFYIRFDEIRVNLYLIVANGNIHTSSFSLPTIDDILFKLFYNQPNVQYEYQYFYY